MSMRQFRRALRACVGRPVAYQIHDGHGAAIAPLLEGAIRGERVHDADILSALATHDLDMERLEAVAEKLAAPTIIPAGKGGKATALVSVRGIALYDVEFQPICFSTLLLAQNVTALANDPEIGTVILTFDTPGGVVTGTPEASDAIFAARNSAKVVALINPLCASAGYWLASQCSEIAAVPSADTGSVGVFLLHANCGPMMEQMGVEMTFIHAGEFKTEGNPYEGLTEAARAHLQSEVDTIYADFVKDVARGRGVSVAKVESDFGQGRTMMAAAAKRAGMIDRIAPINQALARWGVSAPSMEGRRRGEDASRTEEYSQLVEVRMFTADELAQLEAQEPEPDADKADAIAEVAAELRETVAEIPIQLMEKSDAEPPDEPTTPDDTEDDTGEAEREARHRRLALLKRA